MLITSNLPVFNSNPLLTLLCSVLSYSFLNLGSVPIGTKNASLSIFWFLASFQQLCIELRKKTIYWL